MKRCPNCQAEIPNDDVPGSTIAGQVCAWVLAGGVILIFVIIILLVIKKLLGALI